MRLEEGCLILDPVDLELLKEEVDNGNTVKETLNKQFVLSGIDADDICEVQAFAYDLVPYEELILSILGQFKFFA